MTALALITGLLTAAISSISILTLVYLRVQRICEAMKEKGNWAKKPMQNIPEYRLSVWLKRAIYLGGAAGVVSLITLLYMLQIQPSTQFDPEATLIFIIIIIILVEVGAILAGIKYFAENLS